MPTYEEIREALRQAVPPGAWVVDFDDGKVWYEAGQDKYYEAGYTIADGKATLEPPQEVERKVEYVKVSASTLSAAVEKGDDGYGWKWRVRVVDFGVNKNGDELTREPLLAAIDKFNGAQVFMLFESQHTRNQFGKSPRAIVGWLKDPEADDTGIYATFHILKKEKDLRDTLVEAWEEGNPDLLGLSVDVKGLMQKRKNGKRTTLKLLAVKNVTVDVVYDPAAGGKFMRMVAARAAEMKEDTMTLEQLLAALKTSRPKAYAKIEGKINDGTITEEEVLGLLSSISAEEIEGLGDTIAAAVKAAIEPLQVAAQTPPDDGGGGDGDQLQAAQKTLEQAQIVACGSMLSSELGASKLPDASKGRIRKQFSGTVFEPEQLQAALKEEAEYVDTLTGSGSVDIPGQVFVVEGSIENAAKMLDDVFDGNLHSIKAAYIHITGDTMVTGELKAATRLTAAVDSTTFAEILGDAITRRMVKEYKAMGMEDWRKIVSVVPLSDFRTQHRTRMGGYGNLPVVNENDPYLDLTTPGDEEATYKARKRGGIESVTLEAIKNDDTGAIRKIPRKLSRSAKRTLYMFVFDLLRTNPVIYDGVTLFHASHGNLGSAALAKAALTARRNAMIKQTEAGSAEHIGIPPKYLIVPTDEVQNGYDLIAAPRNSDFNPTSPDFVRTLQLELIEVPYWTDPNDWCLAADPADIECIEIGFLDGKEDPELFIQDMPNVGSMFSHDKITFKIRHIYEGAVIDYRGLDKSVVA